MVDFNNERTIGTPAVDIVRVLILQRRADLFEALEDYNKKDLAGFQAELNIVRARLFSLFLEIEAVLRRRMSKEDYESLEINNIEEMKTRILESEDKKEIMKYVHFLNLQLDDIKLTRIDTRKSYDRTSWEEDNKADGL